MKRKLLFSFLVFFIVNIAQSQDKIVFEYDAAGNQIKRFLCLSLNCTTTSKITAPKEVAAIQEEDLQKFTPEDSFSFYPNPVKEELYLKWELVEGKSVSAVYLYNLNGRVLQTYNNLEKKNTLNIPFFNYPSATYLVVLIYNNGEQKSIKIVK